MSTMGTSRQPARPHTRRLRWLIVALAAALSGSAIVVVVLTTGNNGPRLGIDGVSAHRGHRVQSHCRITRHLVPTCGHWWGIAPMAHTSVPLLQAMRDEERTAGRVLDIVHT